MQSTRRGDRAAADRSLHEILEGRGFESDLRGSGLQQDDQLLAHTPVIDYSAHHEPFQYYRSTRNPHHLRPASVAEIGHSGPANHNYDTSDFFAALQAHKLPAVSYIKPPAFQDDHPGNSDSLSAPTFLVDLINALQQSPEWAETAVIISYDDIDGWYDHAVGPIVNQTANNSGDDADQTFNGNDSYVPTLPLSTSVTPATAANITTSGVCGKPAGGAATAPRCGCGPRLPFQVISPWAKEDFVDHSATDQTSSLAFIEFNWDLGFIDGPTALPARALSIGSRARSSTCSISTAAQISAA
jgi:phospholipase C